MKRDPYELRDRREKLIETVRDMRAATKVLEREIELLRVEIRNEGARLVGRLDGEFFAQYVEPILSRNSENGISTRAIREGLKKEGIAVDEDNFRTFLSRYAKRSGYVSVQRTNDIPVWRSGHRLD